MSNILQIKRSFLLLFLLLLLEFLLFFEAGFLCVVLAVLELAL